MFRVISIVVAIGLLLLPVGSNAVFAQVKSTPGLNQNLIGNWTIDIDASLRDVVHHQKFADSSDSEKGRVESVLKTRAEELGLDFSSESMTLGHRDSELVLPCKTRYDNGELIVLACSHGGVPLAISVLILDQDRIKFFSSGTDDTDIYVWKRD